MNGFEDAVSKLMASSGADDFTHIIDSVASKVEQGFTGGSGAVLNELIADELSATTHLNKEKISRITEEVNNRVYLKMYRALKGKLTRDVQFELADPDAVELLLSEKTAMFKEASSLNYEPAYSAPIGEYSPEGFIEAHADELHEKATLQKQAFETSASAFADKIAEFATTIINFERRGNDIVPVMDDIYKTAGYRYQLKTLLKKATEEQVKMFKAANLIEPEFETRLPIAIIHKKDFSLGKFSGIEKTAATLEYRVIEDMTKLAREVKAAYSALTNRREELVGTMDKIAHIVG